MKPWTRWWWLGSAVDRPNLSAQITELDAAGFGGVEVTAIYGAKGADSLYIPYLTPHWVEMIAYTAAEAHRHGMGLDLPQGSGWRTGGPSVVPADANASLDRAEASRWVPQEVVGFGAADESVGDGHLPESGGIHSPILRGHSDVSAGDIDAAANL
jgi:hypothetical protein